jgi:alcohol dehydrogenase (cytochrome c)
MVIRSLKYLSILALALIAVLPESSTAGNKGPPSAGPWATYNNGYDGQRFAPAAQVTAANVATLKTVCESHLGDAGPFHSGLIVIGDTLYVTTGHTTVALDPTNCAIRWRHVYKPIQQEVYPVNRGVAYLDGRIFRGTADGRVLALDARTGKQLWIIKAGDPLKGEFFTSAPLAWKGLVFIGAAGSDWGIRGFVLGLDAKTGREKWRFHTIPMGDEAGSETWERPETALHGGGGLWTTYSLDASTGELFVPVGNPAPDHAPDTRPGTNLYTDSVVVLDALTGKLKWFHQFRANDGLDYDYGAAPALYTSKTGQKLLAAGSQDGYLYGLDRATHQVLFKTAVTTIKNADARPTAAGVLVCPGPLGGVEWNGPAVDPRSQAIYVGAVDFCQMIQEGKPDYEPPGMYLGTAQKVVASVGDPRGWIYAVDGNSGKTLWNYHAEAPVVAGVTPTAGGVVFAGDLHGNLLALDAHSGAELYRLNTGGGIAGGIITYESGGRQYVATTSGNVSRATFSGSTGSPKVVILTTGLAQQDPKIVAVAEDATPASAGAASGAGAASSRGQALFGQNCAACHGASGQGGIGADLRNESARKSPEEVVDFIKNPKAPMPKLYPAPLTDQDVAEVANFIMGFK